MVHPIPSKHVTLNMDPQCILIKSPNIVGHRIFIHVLDIPYTEDFLKKGRVPPKQVIRVMQDHDMVLKRSWRPLDAPLYQKSLYKYSIHHKGYDMVVLSTQYPSKPQWFLIINQCLPFLLVSHEVSPYCHSISHCPLNPFLFVFINNGTTGDRMDQT